MDGHRPIGTEQHITSHADSFKAGVDWVIKKLKDSPQSQWKPSDEQMKALNTINVTGCITDIGQGRLLVELYQDLKKLRKE